MSIWKPTAEEVKLIRAAASREAGTSRIKLEPGIRLNTDAVDDFPQSFNIALVSNDPDWNDTDLADMTDWKFFRKGVTLTDDGRAIVDFYIYSLGDYGELESNIIIYYSEGRLTSIVGTSRGEYLKQVA